MGEIANLVLDHIYTEDDLYEADIWNEPHYHPQVKQCWFCGQNRLYWVKVEGDKWRLADEKGQVHGCIEYKKTHADDTLRVVEKMDEELKRRGMYEAYHGRT